MVAEPVSIREWLDARGVQEAGTGEARTGTPQDDFECPTICLRNAEPVLRERWDETLIVDGDLVVFVPLPQGGGGGKNPLRTILMLAVMVVAPYLGGVIAGALGVTSTIGISLITAGVGLLGATLVNVLLPPPKPALSGFGNAPAPSPTYSLQAHGNQARLLQPIPVIYGRHRVFPDLAAAPWTEYADNDQYLHQLHCIGQGAYDLEQVRIEDTPIASFEEVETEFVPPGGSVTLFEADVVTAPEVAGQELIGVNDREAGEDGWVGPFTANPAGTQATEIGIDVVMPRGLYYANDDGSLGNRTVAWKIEARAIDDEGAAAGDWTELASVSVTKATNTPQRRSYRYTVDAGRYEVRARRTNDKSGDARAGHEIRWGGLKAFLEDVPAFGDVTLLAVRMRATDNLSQRSARMINCIVTRKLPVWDPEAAGPSLGPRARSPGPSPMPPGRPTAPTSRTPASISRHSMRSTRSGRRAATASMRCSTRASPCGRRSPGSPAAAGRFPSCRAGPCGSPATRHEPCRSLCSAPATSSRAAFGSSMSCRARTRPMP